MAGEQVPDWAKPAASGAGSVPDWAKPAAPSKPDTSWLAKQEAENDAKPSALKSVISAILGPVGEAGLNMASGMIAKPVSDVMGGAAMARDALRDKPEGNAQGFRDSVRSALTYQPSGPAGKAIAQYNPLSLIGKGVDAVGSGAEKAINYGEPGTARQMVGAGVHEAINQAPGFLGVKAAKANEGGIATPPKFAPDSPQVTIPKQAVDSGIKVPPQMTGTTSPVAKVLGWIGGKTATEHQASAMNEAALPKLAAKDLGLPEGTPILPANLKPIREEYGSIVKEITDADKATKQGVGMRGAAGPQGSNPVWRTDDQLRNAADKIWSERSTIAQHEGKTLPKEFTDLHKVLQQSDYPPGYAMPKIKSLRAQATESYRKGDYELGAAQKATANALEDFVGRGLEKTGNSDLVGRFQSARQRVAKSYDYEAAADEMGNINAANDKPLSGNAKTIATAANQYPRALQSTARTGGAADHSVASMGAAGLAATQGHFGAAADVLLGRPLARKALLSDYGQRNWAIPQTVPRVSTYQQALAVAHNNPALLAAILQQNQIPKPPDSQ